MYNAGKEKIQPFLINAHCSKIYAKKIALNHRVPGWEESQGLSVETKLYGAVDTGGKGSHAGQA